jgi:hypothetical protein
MITLGGREARPGRTKGGVPMMQDKRADWVVWAARQIGAELTPYEVRRGVDAWDDAYYELCDFIIDQYSVEDAETLIDTVRFGDIALMSLLLATDDDDVRGSAVEKLLSRLDRRLGRERPELAYYFRWYGMAEEDYRSDAHW